MRALALLSFLVLAEGCVIVGGDRCTPTNCNGCCSAAGECLGGTSGTACGTAGNACAVCQGGLTCSLGSCRGGNAGGGFGGGSGGGAGGGFGGGGGSSLTPGDVTFLWNFSSQSCAQSGVQSVHVTIPGQTLANNGVFACNTAGTDGITLLNFAGAPYNFTLEGLSGGTVLYQSGGTFTVNGNVTVNSTLVPPSSSTTSVLVSWSFPPNGASSTPDCSQAGVTDVFVALDNGSPAQLACTSGLGTSIRYDNLTAGVHGIVLEARDANGFVYYRKSSTLTAQAGTTLLNAYAFDWAVGSLPLKWTFSNGTTQLTCAQAGISQVNINLLDAANNYLYGTTGVDVPCLTNTGVAGTVFTYLNGGSYSLYLQAYGTGGVLYRSDFNTPPTVTVVNGQFPVIDGLTQSTLMTP